MEEKASVPAANIKLMKDFRLSWQLLYNCRTFNEMSGRRILLSTHANYENVLAENENYPTFLLLSSFFAVVIVMVNWKVVLGSVSSLVIVYYSCRVLILLPWPTLE